MKKKALDIQISWRHSKVFLRHTNVPAAHNLQNAALIDSILLKGSEKINLNCTGFKIVFEKNEFYLHYEHLKESTSSNP